MKKPAIRELSFARHAGACFCSCSCLYPAYYLILPYTPAHQPVALFTSLPSPFQHLPILLNPILLVPPHQSLLACLFLPLPPLPGLPTSNRIVENQRIGKKKRRADAPPNTSLIASGFSDRVYLLTGAHHCRFNTRKLFVVFIAPSFRWFSTTHTLSLSLRNYLLAPFQSRLPTHSNPPKPSKPAETSPV